MNKYNAKPCEVAGVHFDSKAEAKRYRELLLLEQCGKIADIELQPRYELLRTFRTRSGELVRGISYRADFRYLDLGTNQRIVEDVKGVRTTVYTIKRKLLLSQNPEINFFEV